MLIFRSCILKKVTNEASPPPKQYGASIQLPLSMLSLELLSEAGDSWISPMEDPSKKRADVFGLIISIWTPFLCLSF